MQINEALSAQNVTEYDVAHTSYRYTVNTFIHLHNASGILYA